MASASFTINGTVAGTSEVAVAAGSTVSLALVSTTGVRTVSWSIIGGSDSTKSTPVIGSLAGSPIGATASFTMTTPVGSVGIGWLVKCVINGGVDDEGRAVSAYTATGLVGVNNSPGYIPLTVGEKFERNATHGIADDLNALFALSAGSDATALRGITLDAATVGAPSSGNVIYYDGTKYVAGAPSSLTLTLAQVLADGNTTGGTDIVVSNGDDIRVTGASQTAVLGHSTTTPGLLTVARSGGGETGIEFTDGGAVVVSFEAATGTAELEITGALAVTATGDATIAASTLAGISGATVLVVASAESTITAGTTLSLNAPTVTVAQNLLTFSTTTQNIAANASGIEYHVPTGDSHEFAVNTTVVATLSSAGNVFPEFALSGDAATSGFSRIGLAQTTTDVAVPVLLISGADALGPTARQGGILRLQGGLPSGAGANGQVQLANVLGTAVLTVLDSSVSITATNHIDWASGTASFRIGTTAFLTSTTTLSSFAQPISVTSAGAAVAASGDIRARRIASILVGRNEANTGDLVLLGTDSANSLNVGEDTNIPILRVNANTQVSLRIAGTAIAIARAGQLELQDSNQLDWVTSAALSINNTNWLTSTTSLSSFAQAISVTSAGASIATTGTIRLHRVTVSTPMIVLRNNADTGHVTALTAASDDSLTFGNGTNVPLTILASSTTLRGVVGATTIWSTTATELELASTMALDFAGNAKITVAGVDIITADADSVILHSRPAGGVALGADVANWQSLVRGVFIAAATANPTAAPASGAFLYVDQSTGRPMCWPAGDTAPFEIAGGV